MGKPCEGTPKTPLQHRALRRFDQGLGPPVDGDYDHSAAIALPPKGEYQLFVIGLDGDGDSEESL